MTPSEPTPIVLDNRRVRIAFEREHGRLIALEHGALGIQLVNEPRLAENFRLMVPGDGLTVRYIHGAEQRLSSVTETQSGIALVWQEMRAGDRVLDISVRLEVSLDGDTVTFQISLHNGSDRTVEEVIAPAIGGMAPPADGSRWQFQYHHNGKSHERDFYRDFPHTGLGPERPVWMNVYDTMPWCELYDAVGRRGVYIGNHDSEPRLSMVFQELTPGRAFLERWPRSEEVEDDHPIGAMLAWASLPMVPPGGQWAGPPIIVHFHRGTWYEGADFYRAWFEGKFPRTRPRTWLHDEDAWQTLILLFPDGSHRYRFSDLPAIAAEGRRFGITVLFVHGWFIGGHDAGYPDYRPDPRLGTYEELVEAIHACEAAGTHVMIFANIQVADVTSPLFADLRDYELVDRWGEPHPRPSWGFHGILGAGYPSILGNMAPAAHPLAIMDVATQFGEIITRELEGVLALGASGIQLDKTNLQFAMSFRSTSDQDLAFRRSMLAIIEALRETAGPEVAMAGEIWLDRAIPLLDASYTRTYSIDHLPVLEYTFPDYRLSNSAMGIDYGLVNNCIRYGHVVSVEVGNMHRPVSDSPRFATYVGEVVAIRRRLAAALWNGRLVEPIDVTVDNPTIHLGAFADAGDQLTAVVLTHFQPTAQKVELRLPVQGQRARIHAPFVDVQEAVDPIRLTIPADRLAVIEWLGENE